MRRIVLPAALLGLLSACAGPHYAGSHWNGQRGYGGSGDYGYDLNAARREARSYRAQAQRHYPVPGTASDPWGPYIQEAASHFSIPERWIREVMRQESGGRLESANGQLTTSWVGAMGLMQVMPQTYDMLRRRYALGDDPYEPHDNIMAGAAYIKEMSDRYGAPAFLAAYNAGPDRLDAYLAGSTELPNETVNYLARIAPRLGTEVAMTGPLAVYATGGRPGSMPAYSPPVGGYGGSYAVASNDPADRAYAGGGMSGMNYYSGNRDTVAASAPHPAPYQPPVAPVSAAMAAPVPTDRYAAAAPAVVAMEPIPNPPEPSYTPPSYTPAAYQPAPARPRLMASAQAAERLPAVVRPSVTPASALVSLAAPGSAPAGWGVQVGAFPDPERSRGAVRQAQQMMGGALSGTQPVVMPVARNGTTLYRARLVGLSPDMAASTCSGLERRGIACLTVPPGS